MLSEVNKKLIEMVKQSEIRKNWEKIKSQLDEARRFIAEEKIDEALYFTWLAAENIVNTLKVLEDGYYLKEHRAKTDFLKGCYALGKLKKDYSKPFEKLSKYRIVAEFHPYTSIPKDYTKKDVLSFLERIQELKKEAEKNLKKW